MKSRIHNSKSKIYFLASGTLGDIQPYVALGMGLRAAGFGVRVVTHPEFRPFVEGSSLEFAPLLGNPSTPMTRPGGQSALTYDGNLRRSLSSSLDYLREVRPVYRRMLESAWQAFHDPEGKHPAAIVLGLPTAWGAHIAEALGVPCIWAFLQPVTRTQDYPSALLPSTFSLGREYNSLTHILVETAMGLPWRSLIRSWQVNTLGLKHARLSPPLKAIYSPRARVIYGYSQIVAPPPADWPSHHHVTGYWTMPPDPGYVPPPGLEKFLGAGPSPLYIGFGSPGIRNPQQTLQIILGALETAGLRAVLSYPSEQVGGMRLPPFVHLEAQVSHTWLFPLMTGLVHHGGAGTAAAGLHAGVPALVAPLAVDQFFWGKRIAELGCGPASIPQRELSASRLGAALHTLVSNPTYRVNSMSMKASLLAENGVFEAVEKIQGWI